MAQSVLARAKTQLVLHEPFYATILLKLEVVECESVPGLGPLWLAATDGQHLYVNPKNFEQLSVAKAKGVLKHEVMHVAQLHPFRGQGKEHARWNKATDDVINPMIIDEGGELPDGVRPGIRGMSAEERYKDLPPEPPGQGGGGSGPHDPLGHDVLPAPDKSQAAVDKTKAMIAQAASIAKARGKLPESLRSEIDKILRPRVDWKEQLRQWLTEATQSDYSFRRPNRRFITGENPIYLPSMMGDNQAMDTLVVVLDTSGSITMAELSQGLGEICGAVADVSPKRLVVAYCDAKVQHHDVFDQPQGAEVAKSFERHGAGGTNMVAALKWVNRNYPTAKGVIVWTDGETPFGNEEDYEYPVLWAITSPRIEADWGTTLHVTVGDD